MSSDGIPKRHQPTRVRRVLGVAEQIRYALEYRKRLRHLKKALPEFRRYRLTGAVGQEIREYWRSFGIRRVNLDWYRLFGALREEVNPRFVPEETFRVFLEPMLCRRDVAPAYHDKNQLDRLFPETPKPSVALRNIFGRYFDGAYVPLSGARLQDHLEVLEGDYFLKPSISGTGSGHNVVKATLEKGLFHIHGRNMSLEEVEAVYIQDFLLQEPQQQHASVSAFHPASLNTIRITTLRMGDAINPTSALFRMGNGRDIDNGYAGGLLCGVDLQSGRLTSSAVDIHFRRYLSHPLSGRVYSGVTLPSFDRVKNLAVRLHERLPYFDVVSFDLAIDPTGEPALVEVNTFGQGVEPHQILNGTPLFGAFSDDVLRLVQERRMKGWNT